MKNTLPFTVTRWKKRHLFEFRHDLAVEEPLEIHIEDSPYAIVMRSPGEEMPLAAGFCLSEGLIDNRADLASLGYCEDSGGNLIRVFIEPRRRSKIKKRLERKNFRSQTSCGVCGKEVIEDICLDIKGITGKVSVSLELLTQLGPKLREYQPLFKKTGCTHAAVIFDSAGIPLSAGEDVGRHNAFDKAIGKLLLSGELTAAAVAVVSGRGSFEMVQKAGRAGIPILASVSAPTRLAVDLAERIGMTLIGFLRPEGMNFYTGEERIEKS